MKLTILFFLVSFSLFGQKQADDSALGKALSAEMAYTNAMKEYILENYEKASFDFSAIIKKFGDSGGAYFMLSKAQWAIKDINPAILNIQKAVELDKNNYYYLQHLAFLQGSFRDLKGASQTLKKLIKIRPNYGENYNTLAETLIEIGEEGEALKVLEEMEREIGTSQEITQKKQLILLKKNKLNDALKAGNEFIKDDPEYVIKQAQVLLSNEKTSEATRILRLSLKENPGFLKPYAMLSDIHLSNKDKNAHVGLLLEVLQLPQMADEMKIQLLNKQASFPIENKDELIELIGISETLLLNNEKSQQLHAVRGDFFVKSGDIFKARDAYLNAVKTKPSFYEAWLAILELDEKLGLQHDLLTHSQKAVELFPSQPHFWLVNGQSLKHNGELEDAILAFEEGCRLSLVENELQMKLQIALAESYFDIGETAKAKKQFEQGNSHYAEQEDFAIAQAVFLLKTGLDNKSVEELINDLKSKNTGKPRAVYAIALNSFKAGKYAEALGNINLALPATPTPSAEIYELKGDILFNLGDIEKAMDWWQKALAISPKSEALKQKISERK
jgi:tetratricopeptide (TPR) repeat protein